LRKIAFNQGLDLGMTDNHELAFWNKRFSEQSYLFGTEPNAFLSSQRARLRPGMRALAIADGEGRNGVWLAEQGLNVLSVDFSPVALKKADELAATAQVTLETECVDLATWDWGAPRFDLVAAIFIQFAAPDLRDHIFQKMKDVLVPGGLLLLEGYGPKQLAFGTGGPQDVNKLYTPALLKEAFGDLDILALEEYEADLSEGERHKGMSAVVDLVAQKAS
jgi:cyclopropane fatty-acyl-phospholipid synthase-like methyltransferase